MESKTLRSLVAALTLISCGIAPGQSLAAQVFVLANAPQLTPCELPLWPAAGQYEIRPDGTYSVRHSFSADHCDLPAEFAEDTADGGRYRVAGDTLHLSVEADGALRYVGFAIVQGDSLLVHDEGGDLIYRRITPAG